jgi:ADP-heptose:LPS heptosyltransferase/glycosyltransferase involved in cell wall biosynthesis/2-polyprenyl-3-methyl-5-hydroxy-6-metoxy-1,4-benzoquinol methylase
MTTLVSCIMPTCDRRAFVPAAIEYFLRQDYPNAELVIVDDGSDPVADVIPGSERIRYVRLPNRASVGAKRNIACEHARGDVIVHWDDDDWHAPHRLSYQVRALQQARADACGIRTLLFFEIDSQRAWRYVFPSHFPFWLSGSTLCYTRAFWAANRFDDIDISEDARFVRRGRLERLLVLPEFDFHIGIIHAHNVSRKNTRDSYWTALPADHVRRVFGADWDRYRNGTAPGYHSQPETTETASLPDPQLPERTSTDTDSAARPKALVTASLGIGDVLRVTPLIRVLHRQGYTVDVLLEPDYAQTTELLNGAPEIRRLFYRTSARCHPPQQQLAGLAEERYEIATFTHWSAPLQTLVNTRRKLVFDRNAWLQQGDSRCIEQIVRELGWTGDMPSPFAIASGRRFDLSPNTVALHAGCKPDWAWKKWHGFDELAAMLPEIALIGMPSDLDNAQTYFRKEFRWPPQVRNFVGTLSLPDTAALISQCKALVSNDSGLMHLGVALGVPTYGIFGITSPQREMIPARNMFPVTKGLTCEPECRKQPWGRRDCEHHLECLKTLTAGEVVARMAMVHPGEGQTAARFNEEVNAVPQLGVEYHGHVFDASGYGNAARAYIRALHAAGVDLSVVDLSLHQRQVRDEFVESLVGRKIRTDFHLFHGIPHVWAQEAFRLSNAVVMTVWETDTMPTQWCNALNHALEVWLPCEFNVNAFQTQLRSHVARIPHAAIARNGSHPLPEPGQFLRVSAGDFVVYSIFEWQDRKCPAEQIRCFLQAFSANDNAVLILKTNPGAAGVAASALAEARRQFPSGARVELRCEAWDESQIAALHRRGDCYLSLHRGEGWCYPLFEAACNGTPVVATAYSGPLDYLDQEHHQLVPYRLTPVCQPYLYYHRRMKWAEPDATQAASRLRWVFENREAARQKASDGASKLRGRYSLEEIGKLAKARLIALLERTNRTRWEQIRTADRAQRVQPPVPIPASWYDQDYFEMGIKSNWSQGYSWELFSGLFRGTASFLTSMFPRASSFLDIGCSKGFLVRCLRESGKACWGLDFSPWAIEHADSLAAPFLQLAALDDYAFDRRFDVLLAFSILESLTEAQINHFLTRAKAAAGTALLAVISSFETPEEEHRFQREDNDLSHITVRSRRWWHERFLECGWRHDAATEALQRRWQSAALPLQMGWKIYVYAPG